MGFKDITVDRLSVDNLKKETEKYNDLYFGKSVFFNDNQDIEGQLVRFNKAKQDFVDEQFSEVNNYFDNLGWDNTEKNNVHTRRAEQNIYISYQYNGNYFIEFRNNNIQESYAIKIESDFEENPYYRVNTNSRGYGKRYTPINGEATRVDMIKERLDEIKAVVEHNASLKSVYNFKILVDKDANNNDRYESDILRIEYKSVMDIINEISEEYY